MATATPSAAKKAPAKKLPVTTSTATPAPARNSRAKPDAIQLLTKDHKEAKALFKKYEKLCKADAAGEEKKAVAMEVCMKLTVHAQIEEEIFYPGTRSDKTDDLLDEAEVEHASAKDLIAQIQSMSPEDDLYDAKVTVLGEYINHHVEEEEGELFPKVQRLKLDLPGMGAQLMARKLALLGEMATATE